MVLHDPLTLRRLLAYQAAGNKGMKRAEPRAKDSVQVSKTINYKAKCGHLQYSCNWHFQSVSIGNLTGSVVVLYSSQGCQTTHVCIYFRGIDEAHAHLRESRMVCTVS